MKNEDKMQVKQGSVANPVTGTETVRPAAIQDVPKTRRVTFSVRAGVGSKVFLAGDFNKWDPTAKEMSDKKGEGVYTATLNLPVGDHPYKFVIDGTWCVDPECADWVQNDHGTLNSIKRVT